MTPDREAAQGAASLQHRRSVAWSDGHLEIVDQTLLPGTFALRRLETADAVVEAIRALRVRGAPAIGLCGAYGVVTALGEQAPCAADDARRVLDAACARIAAARPTAVNLSWAVERVHADAVGAADLAAMRAAALRAAQALQEENRAACERIAANGRELLRDAERLLTHCNTGWLACGDVGTALGIVHEKARHGDALRVLACEARPLLQGGRITTWELMQAGIDVTVIPDGAAAWAMAANEVDAVVVGADRIAANGDTANKIGTYALALAARAAGIPFVVAAPRSSFDPTIADGGEIVIELRDAEEVATCGGTRIGPEGVAAWNPAFDVTPAELISAFVTEDAVLEPPYATGVVAPAAEGAR